MKKFLTLVVMAACCNCIFAQSEVSDTTQVKKPRYSFSKNFNHWSLAVSGGFNFLMSERDQEAGAEIQNFSKENFLGAFNFQVDYTFNPIWGVSLEYMYSPINKECIFEKNGDGSHPEKNASGHQVYALLDVNLLNLFCRYRNYPKWGWYTGLGIGTFIYNSSKDFIKDGTSYYSVIPMFPFETHVDYSPISDLSIFLKVAMDIYLRDDVNVCKDGAMNDWNLYGGVGLRWNICANGKPHVRSVDMNTYYGEAGNNGNGTDTAAQNRIKKLEDQVKDLQDQVKKAGACCDDIDAIRKQADTNADDIRRLKIKLDSVKTHTTINTEIADNSVYFDHNSWVIDAKYQSVIEKVARVMMSYPQLQLDITSFCSKVGNQEKNKIVGENRIEAVKAVLIETYGIDPRRIHAFYSGQVFDGLQSENRRCDLNLR